ncbi:MAG: hypothetical protein QM630_05930 [Microbacterium sp.]
MRRWFGFGVVAVAVAFVIGGTVVKDEANAAPSTATDAIDVLYLYAWLPRVPSWEEAKTNAAASHAKIVDECKAYVPYSHRNDRDGWMRFCDSLPAPVIGEYVVVDRVTGEVVR